MSTYAKCNDSVSEMAESLLEEFETHHPIRDAGVKIDFVFAFGSCDECGETKGPAITVRGMVALGVCRILPLKDRAMGRGDAEIILDGDRWPNMDLEEQRALLDHELHHIAIRGDQLKKDDLGRPVLRMRKHDSEFGWFRVIAARHGEHSQERKQAKRMAENDGQFYWPELFAPELKVLAKGGAA